MPAAAASESTTTILQSLATKLSASSARTYLVRHADRCQLFSFILIDRLDRICVILTGSMPEISSSAPLCACSVSTMNSTSSSTCSPRLSSISTSAHFLYLPWTRDWVDQRGHQWPIRYQKMAPKMTSVHTSVTHSHLGCSLNSASGSDGTVSSSLLN